MSSPLSQRTTAAVFIATGVAVVVIFALFVWPGFPAGQTVGCSASVGPTVMFGSRTYCYESVTLTQLPLLCPLGPAGNWSGPSLEVLMWGFTFHLAPYTCQNVSGIAISIAEPNGNVTVGATDYGGPPGIAIVTGVFTDDWEAGVAVPQADESTNATLYVETGS